MEVRIESEAHSDLGILPPDLLRVAYAEMVSLKNDPLRGDELEVHPEVGDLSDCRKLYFNRRRHRVIYQVLPSEENPRQVLVIAVGRRANLRVYHDAALRLGRTPGVDAPEK